MRISFCISSAYRESLFFKNCAKRKASLLCGGEANVPVRLFSGRRTFPGCSEKLGKNHSGKHESAAEQFPPGKSLVQQQSPAQGTKHTFKAHQQRGQRRRQMLLPNDLNGIGYAAGKHARIQDTIPAGQQTLQAESLKQPHGQQCIQSYKQKLYTAQGQGVIVGSQPIDHQYLHRKSQGTGKSQKIPFAEGQISGLQRKKVKPA